LGLRHVPSISNLLSSIPAWLLLYWHSTEVQITQLLGQQLLVLLRQTHTLNGKIFMLLCEHNPIDNSVTGDTIAVQGSRV
jgi:hypothetical protein